MGRALDNQHASWAFTGSRTWRPRLTAAPRYLAAAERDGRLRVPEKRRGAGHSPGAKELERRTERPPAQALGHTPPPRPSEETLVRGRKRVSPQSRKFLESSGFANGPRGSSRVAHARTRGQPPPSTPSGQRSAFLLQGRPPHPRASMARPGPALHLPQPAASSGTTANHCGSSQSPGDLPGPRRRNRDVATVAGLPGQGAMWETRAASSARV